MSRVLRSLLRVPGVPLRVSRSAAGSSQSTGSAAAFVASAAESSQSTGSPAACVAECCGVFPECRECRCMCRGMSRVLLYVREWCGVCPECRCVRDSAAMRGLLRVPGGPLGVWECFGV